jgi:GDPmannose 4,6-dehydratase
MRRALIIGHAGQDGRILWDQLLERGFAVVGVSSGNVRTHGMEWTAPVDIADAGSVQALAEAFRPSQVYYLAAHHHSSQDASIKAADTWDRSWAVHVHGFGHVLQALVSAAPAARVFYAASSRVFGATTIATPLDETTPYCPDDSYGVTKAAGMLLADHYRRVHGQFVSCGILFNHESPLRGPRFVTQRVVRGLIAITRGEATQLEVGSLDARVDWGYAPDYTRAMQAMLEAQAPGDFVVATGTTHSVRDLVEIAAAHLGVDWRRVVVEKRGVLQRGAQDLCGDASRLRNATGWVPSIDFPDMVRLLVDAAKSI